MFSVCCCVASESVSGKDGGSVPLKTNVTKGQHDIILWAFNGILIARINANPSDSCLYDGEGGRFRDRLEVDYETGSLTIKNITAEHTGRYEAEIIKSESSGTRESLNRKHKCNSNKVTPKTNYLGKTKTYNVSVIGELFSIIYLLFQTFFQPIFFYFYCVLFELLHPDTCSHNCFFCVLMFITTPHVTHLLHKHNSVTFVFTHEARESFNSQSSFGMILVLWFSAT